MTAEEKNAVSERMTVAPAGTCRSRPAVALPMSPRGRTCLVSRLPELPPCLPTPQPGALRVSRLT